jgi:uncharacterized caspase-like protein/tetratricopeptide (TPR) repeat protein
MASVPQTVSQSSERSIMTRSRVIFTILLITVFGVLLTEASFAQKTRRPRPRPTPREVTPPEDQNKNPQTNRGISLVEFKSGVAPDGRGKLWAVVIGVSNYKNLEPDSQLRFAHRDAEELAAFFSSPQGGGFPSTQIKVLLNEQATIASIRTALGTWLPRSAEPNDVVYIFFAGHGVVEQGGDGYMMAHDSDPQNLYATALPISELDRIVAEKLKSRVTVLFADACHSGKIGMTSRSTEEEVLISRYLDEVGKSGTGTFKLLASRADERSYEDKRWGGGHGVFTYYLLEGMKGKADRDRDGVVRAGELLDFISQIVPEQTSALQHPRAAGNIDTRLPLAVSSTVASQESASVQSSETRSLEVRGAAGSEVYLNKAYRGRIRPDGSLVIEGLGKGETEISIDLPGAETINQTVALAATKTVIDFNVAIPARASIKSSPLVDQIREALAKDSVLEQGGAWPLYEQLIKETPDDPQREDLETELTAALDEIGQQAINNYVRTSAVPFKREQLLRASNAYTHLLKLKPSDKQVESKVYFSAARLMLADGKAREAIVLLEKSMSVDPKTACPFNALGVAYERTNDIDKALDFYKRAVTLAPGWSLPRHRLGLQYYARGKRSQAESEFQSAIKLDPAFLHARWWLTHVLFEQNDYKEAEREAKELIRLAPGYAPAHAELGLIYEAQRKYDDAAEAFNEYLKLSPGSIQKNVEQVDQAKTGSQTQPQSAQSKQK